MRYRDGVTGRLRVAGRPRRRVTFGRRCSTSLLPGLGEHRSKSAAHVVDPNGKRKRITTTAMPAPSTQGEFELLVQDHLDQIADDAVESVLRADEQRWRRTLQRIFDDVDDTLFDLRRDYRGPNRAQVLADFEDQRARVAIVLGSLGDDIDLDELDAVDDDLVTPPGERAATPTETAPRPKDGVAQLQLSWTPGQLIAWSSGPNARHERTDAVLARLEKIGGGQLGWQERRAVKVPDGSRADATETDIINGLGWLTALRTVTDDTTGASVSWMGAVAALAVQLATQGRMVPTVKKLKRRLTDEQREKQLASYVVRWVPALIEEAELTALAESLPPAVTVLENRRDAKAFTIAVLSDLIDAVCCTAAARLETPAPPEDPRTKTDVSEVMLANLDGKIFDAPSRYGSEIASRIDRWSRPITGPLSVKLTVLLDPPGDANDWYLAVKAPGPDGDLEPIESAMVNSGSGRGKDLQDHLTRLERLFPPLLRPGARRRGEVILSQDEAWQLMSGTGDALMAAGYDVKIPLLGKGKPAPSLKLTADDADESVVGAQQLANVSWSAVFDDVELTAEDIRALAAEARPLVQSRGRWVELDKADLAAAARALADRADTSRLTGADMLRHALGLEGSPLSGGISLGGEGWAADLLRSAGDIPDDLPTSPDGFEGELRHYQAEALAWLQFLDRSGLGGCLALDMGLGKTPTMLADILSSTSDGPSLVIAPPAVVGNWAVEARRFTPGLDVVVHHGPNRVDAARFDAMANQADLVITTYGTAVRDVDALEKVAWGKVVLDEAQAIKNPASDTAQQLRRIPARTRLALTGTPIENGLGDLWAILDFANPGLVGPRASFIASLSEAGTGKDAAERALRALNGILVFRRTKLEPAIAAELPDRIDELDHCAMTAEQIGLYQAVLDDLVRETADDGTPQRKGAVLAAITALKQICNHPVNFQPDDDGPIEGRSGKLARLDEILETVFAAGERVLVFTHFASWGERLAVHLSERFDMHVPCYHGGLGRGARDKLVSTFQEGTGAGAMVLSLKAGGTGLNLTAANHVVLYDRWWNPAVEDQARDRVWRIGQKNKVICHRLVCPGTVDERVEEVVAGKRRIADMVLPKSSSVGDLDSQQLQVALGIDPDQLLTDDETDLDTTALASTGAPA